MKYLIEWIPIEHLRYVWSNVEGNKRYTPGWLELSIQIEKNLREGKHAQAISGPDGFNIKFMIYIQEEYKKVYDHIKNTAKENDYAGAIVNPLIVYKATDYECVVLCGNRRFSALKALNWIGKVKCVLNPDWEFRKKEEFNYIEIIKNYDEK